VTSLALTAVGPVNHKWESRVMMRHSSVKNPSMIRNPFCGISLNHLHKQWTTCTAPPWKHHQSFMWDHVMRIIHDSNVKQKSIVPAQHQFCSATTYHQVWISSVLHQCHLFLRTKCHPRVKQGKLLHGVVSPIIASDWHKSSICLEGVL
jgi:hypothetical protein